MQRCQKKEHHDNEVLGNQNKTSSQKVSHDHGFEIHVETEVITVCCRVELSISHQTPTVQKKCGCRDAATKAAVVKHRHQWIDGCDEGSVLMYNFRIIKMKPPFQNTPQVGFFTVHT